MDLAFATDQVDPPERLTAWRELISRVFLPLAITPIGGDGQPGTFDGLVAGHSLGELQVWRVKASPMSAVRSRQHIKTSANDDYLLALHVKGTAHAAQDGREVSLGPGDFALFDSSRPYSIAFPGPGTFEHVIYQVPRASLDARRPLREATALRVSAATAAGQLVFPYLKTLARHAESRYGQVPARAFTDAGLDLAVSALRATAGYPDQPGPGHRSPASELRNYALAHLGDPGLSPQAAARASYVSARQLHRLFAREGLTFGGWIREERLRRCYDDLVSQQLAHLPIAQIAARWGFRSPAHFARAFQERYGITPTSHRRLHAPAHDRRRERDADLLDPGQQERADRP